MNTTSALHVVKKNQIWKSKSSGSCIQILSKHSGNKHWNTKKLSGGKAHKIHEGTLQKYYELVS